MINSWNNSNHKIAAIVLAAGNSIRMGFPKLILKWGNTTVIEKVVSTLEEARIQEVLVVTGRYHKEIIEVLKDHHVELVFNPDFDKGEMLSSVKKGISCLDSRYDAALIVLGDQPQIELGIIFQLINRYYESKKKIVVPSYQMHKGHPWLIDQALWEEILDLDDTSTLKNYLNASPHHISYVDADTPSVIQDLDTPEDYDVYHP